MRQIAYVVEIVMLSIAAGGVMLLAAWLLFFVMADVFWGRR